jgi:hypothetical protein
MTAELPQRWSTKFLTGTRVFFCEPVFASLKRYRDQGIAPRVRRGAVCRMPPSKNADRYPWSLFNASYRGDFYDGTEPKVLVMARNGDKCERPESEIFRTRAAAERALMVEVMQELSR